jgi:hypothetical protein
LVRLAESLRIVWIFNRSSSPVLPCHS